MAEAAQLLTAARSTIARVIVGQETVVEHCLLTLLCGGHALLEGVPGIGKTLLVRTLGQVLGCPTGRIQFTPDLMPSDITGTSVFNLRDQTFNFVPGPIFTTFLLADEINRAPAKTQAALLQAMQERQVTVDRQTYPLDASFAVFATQNPIEQEGTYPLPEAQKDRFLLRILMGYPSAEEEFELARRILRGPSPEAVLAAGLSTPSLPAEALAALRATVATIEMKDEVARYATELVRATRREEALLTGAGPRATLALLATARAHALLDGRDFATPDDLKAMLGPVLEHRLVLRPEFEIEGMTVAEAVSRVQASVPVPR